MGHAFEHQAALGLDQLALFGVGQRRDQFVLGVRAGRQKTDQTFEQRLLVARRGVRALRAMWVRVRYGP